VQTVSLRWIHRTGKEEQSLPLRVVDPTSHRLPESFDELVFIEEAGGISIQHQPRVHSRGAEGSPILIEAHFRSGKDPCARGFSHGLGPGDQHAPMRPQPISDDLFDNSVRPLGYWGPRGVREGLYPNK